MREGPRALVLPAHGTALAPHTLNGVGNTTTAHRTRSSSPHTALTAHTFCDVGMTTCAADPVTSSSSFHDAVTVFVCV